MSSKKPSQLLHDKLRKRAIDHVALINAKTPKHLLKSPSQKKSESERKKYVKKAGVIFDHLKPYGEFYDCFTCPKYPCVETLQQCNEKNTRIQRCKQCDIRVTYRFDPEVPWEYCPVCMVRRKE